MFLFPIVAATAVSVCLMPNPLMKALMRVMMNTITWMTMVKVKMMMKTKDNNHHQDNVVQDLCACMAVLIVDVDHGNQKE